MSDIYFENMLGNQRIMIGTLPTTLVAQIFVIIENKGMHLCLLGEGKKEKNGDYRSYFLCSTKDGKTLYPLPRQNLKEVLVHLKKVYAENSVRELFDGIKEEVGILGKGVRRIKLSSCLSCEIMDETINEEIDNLYVEISGIRFNLNWLICYCENGMDHRISVGISTSELTEIYKCHLLSGIQLYVNGRNNGYYAPMGFEINDETLELKGMYEEVYFLQSTKIRNLKYNTERATPLDLVDFMISGAGFRDRVTGAKEEGNKWFLVIIPILGLKIDEDFGLGSVRYIRKDNEEIQRIIGQTEGAFDCFDTFALVHIDDYTMHSAFQKAKSQIRLSITLLLNLLRDDSARYMHGLSERIVSRTMEMFDYRIELSSWFYLEQVFPRQQLFGDEKHWQNTEVSLNVEDINNLKDVEEVELQLFKAYEDPQSIQAGIFNSLKWIQKAWESDDDDDKVINAIIALEFIVASEKGVPLLTKGKRKKIQNGLLQLIIENMEDELNEEGAKKLAEKFSLNCTETPFMAKLRALITRLSIPVSEEDVNLIAKAREKRNGIVHGKQSEEITRNELRLLCEIISTIAFYKLNERIKEDGNYCELH